MGRSFLPQVPHSAIPTNLSISSFALSSLLQVSEMTVTVKDALSQLDDRRVKATRPLIPPAILQEDLPL